MRPVLVFGSLNLDYVYTMDRFVRPKETRRALSQRVLAGGKGLNQSIACARAGACVQHAGCVGRGGDELIDTLRKAGVDVAFIERVDELQGNAMIQVDASGENCIIIFGGSNTCVSPEQVDRTLSCAPQETLVVLQNEISCLDYILKEAKRLGLEVILNPAPMGDELKDYDLSAVSWLIVNEVEAEQFLGSADPKEAYKRLCERWPKMSLLLTLGEKGAYALSAQEDIVQPAFPVKAVDTTAAGDTFTGYFVAGYAQGHTLSQCMEKAAMASAIAVTRPGAAPSIPYAQEVYEALA